MKFEDDREIKCPKCRSIDTEWMGEVVTDNPYPIGHRDIDYFECKNCKYTWQV